jgi:sugar phosphate isomerase/epimerase
LGCTSLAFSRVPLEEALERVARLGFENVDLGAIEGWAHVEPSRLAADRQEAARVARALNGSGLKAVALNAGVGSWEDSAAVLARTEALAELAELVGATVITLQAPRSGITVEQAVAQLAPVCAVSARTGVCLTLETHRGQITELPEDALAIAARTGLGLTLDPSHIIAGPAEGVGLMSLAAQTRHLHVRDARPDSLEVSIGEGILPFGSLFEELAAAGRTASASIEYIQGGTGRTIEDDLVRAGLYVALRWPGPVDGAAGLVEVAP